MSDDGSEITSGYIAGISTEEFCNGAAYALNNLPYLVNIIGMPDYRVIFINKSMREFLEATKHRVTDEDIGKPAWDVFPRWNEAFYAAFEEARITKQVRRLRDLEYRIDDKLTYWDIALVPNIDASGEVTSITSVRVNMTERREAEETLRAATERFRMITETVTDAIITINEDSTVLYANSATEKVFGYCPGELVGQSLTLLMPERLRQAHLDVLREYIETRQKHTQWTERQLPGLHRDGREIPLEVSYGDFIKDGKHIFVGIVRDITERIQAEEERDRLLKHIGKRAMELNCLYQVASLGQAPHIDADDIMRQAVELLPPAYQYPEVAEARIVISGKEYRTPRFRETQWMQSARIVVDERVAGSVTVSYVEERPEADEGPFLREERYLINTIARNLGAIMEREQAEAASSRSEANFRALFEYMPAAIFAYDREGVILQVNPACERMYGFSSEQLVGRHIWDALGRSEQKTATEEIIARVFAGETIENTEWEDTRSDGSSVYVLTNVTPVYDINGKVVMGLSLNIDITERKLAETKRRELTAHKREFYRQTIFAATEGKLLVTERDKISRLEGRCIGSWKIKDSRDVSMIRGKVARLALQSGMEEQRIDDFVQCAGEAATNAYKHGGGGVASLYALEDGLLLVVSDRGPGIEAVSLPELALRRGYTTAASLGMGYKMMIALADRVYLATDPGGTMVAIEMKLRTERARPAEEILAAALPGW